MKIHSLDQHNGKKFRANEKIKQNSKTSRYFSNWISEEKRFYVTGIFQCVYETRTLYNLAGPGLYSDSGVNKGSCSTSCTYQCAWKPVLLSHSENKITAVQRNKIKSWWLSAFLKNLCTCAKGTSLLVSSQIGAQSKQDEGQKAERLAESPSMIL